MKPTFPIKTIFYTIEETIKEYRRFSQNNIAQWVPDMTVDQLLVLTLLDDHPHLSQVEIAQLIFKDNAAITRMIESMAKKGYLSKATDQNDRRRHKLLMTQKGKATLKQLAPTILSNRKTALDNLTGDELAQLSMLLKKITSNCTRPQTHLDQKD